MAGAGDDVWLGVEASGQLIRLEGDAEAAPSGQHYIGPSLTIERRLGASSEVEMGIAYLRRVERLGPGSSARLFVQFGF